MSVYYSVNFNFDRIRMFFAGTSPDMLAEGDSWFSYPQPVGNLTEEISNLYAGNKTILNLAKPGDDMADIMKPASQKKLIKNLKTYSSIKALIFSGGGNDFIGNLHNMLESNCASKTSAIDCFKPGALAAQTTRTTNLLRSLITLRNSHRPDVPIIAHQYDYVTPSNNSAVPGVLGPWMKPKLDDVHVPVALHLDVARLLGDQYANILAGLADSRFIVIPTLGTLTSSNDWANETHPSKMGHEKLALKFQPVLLPIVI
jgi:lysophospholipase L1-like esterase